MKTLAVGLTALLVLSGCSRESPRGGPGAKSGTTTTATTNDGQTRTEQTRTETDTTNRADTFTVKVPSGATNVTQGKSSEIHISLDRGRDFRQAVKLKFEAPRGIKAIPEVTIAGADNKVAVNVEATDDATVGRHTIVVTGTPETGKSASVNMDIDVKKRE